MSAEHGSNAPVVALRADLDALAMTDDKDVHYASQVPGVAHACGDDVHTTIVRRAVSALAQRLGDEGVDGGVRLVFESAEETVPGGALDAIAAGALDGVSAIYGLHCDPKLDTGQLGTRVGLDLVGGRHGPHRDHRRAATRPAQARPVDMVAVASRLALELPEEVRSRATELGEASLGLRFAPHGSGGQRHSAHAESLGSIRTPERRVWNALPTILKDSGPGRSGSRGAGHGRYTRGVLGRRESRRRHATTRAVRPSSSWAPKRSSTLLRARVETTSPGIWKRFPVHHACLGVNDPSDGGKALDLHAGNFDVDERAIGVGIRVLTEVALDTLAGAGPP